MGTEKPRAKYGFVLGVAVARSDDLGSSAYVAVDATNNALYTPRPLAANGVPHLHRHHHHQFKLACVSVSQRKTVWPSPSKASFECKTLKYNVRIGTTHKNIPRSSIGVASTAEGAPDDTFRTQRRATLILLRKYDTYQCGPLIRGRSRVFIGCSGSQQQHQFKINITPKLFFFLISFLQLDEFGTTRRQLIVQCSHQPYLASSETA